MCFSIRTEQPGDYRAVEALTRDAFYNLHVPGCDEHLIVRNLRGAKAFVKALDFVAFFQNQLVGNILYTRARVEDERGAAHGVLSFGPLSVLPGYQRRGVGSALVRHSLAAARDMGFPAVIIWGDPAYYERFGFLPAKAYGIYSGSRQYHPALLALALSPGGLSGVKGMFIVDEAFQASPAELEAFERLFPYREKRKTQTQDAFARLAGAGVAVDGSGAASDL